MEERERILKLLEEGKITAQEAAKLLEALAETNKWGPRHFAPGPDFGKRIAKKIELSLKDLPQKIENGLWFVDTAGDKEAEYKPHDRFLIKAVSGDVKIVGDEAEVNRVKLEGGHKVNETDKELVVKTMSGDIDVKVPKSQKVELKGASGDFQISNIEAELRLRCGAGDIDIDGLSGTLIATLGAGDIDAKSVKGDAFIGLGSGDVDIDFIECKGGKVEAGSGDICICLPENANLEVTIHKPKRGSIVSDFDFEPPEGETEEFKFNIGKPENKLYIKIKYGDINIRKRSG